jgi:hypothetical protein
MLFVPLILALVLQAGAQTNIAGKWQATTTPGTTWVFDLQVEGNKVTGTVSQTGDKTESAPIYFGSIEGNTVSFKVTSPDGDRIITFVGKITPVDIGFERLVEVRPGGSRGDTSVFGGNALLNISARRPTEGGAAGGRGARGARGGRGQQ